jgi:hypothetical protein
MGAVTRASHIEQVSAIISRAFAGLQAHFLGSELSGRTPSLAMLQDGFLA